MWTFGLCSLCSKGGDCETESQPTGEKYKTRYNHCLMMSLWSQQTFHAGSEEEQGHPSAEELRNAEPLTFALLEVVTMSTMSQCDSLVFFCSDKLSLTMSQCHFRRFYQVFTISLLKFQHKGCDQGDFWDKDRKHGGWEKFLFCFTLVFFYRLSHVELIGFIWAQVKSVMMDILDSGSRIRNGIGAPRG